MNRNAPGVVDPGMRDAHPVDEMNIEAWLEDIGLPQYSSSFREHAVDEDVLPDLDHDALLQLGVVAVGDRIRLLKAIAAFVRVRSDSNAGSLATVTTYSENRQITVFFCDMVGSTAIAANVGPEVFRSTLTDFHGLVTEAVELHGGYVAQYLGDGVLAYFGFPLADELSPSHAVLAGIQAQRTLDNISRTSGEKGIGSIRARIGIHTGPVVVDTVSNHGRQEPLAFGETPNVASRLQSVAPPGGIVVSDSTATLVSRRFVLEPVPLQRETDLAALRGAYLVTGDPSQPKGRTVLTPPPRLIGRGSAMRQLKHAWERTITGEGGHLIVEGDAGVGKSALLAEFLRTFQIGHVDSLFLECSPLHPGTAFHPLILPLRNWLDGMLLQSRDSSVRGHLHLLDHFGVPSGDPRDGLIELLGLKSPDSALVREASVAGHRRRRLIRTISEMLRCRADHSPLCLVVEDSHWIDPSTGELMDELSSTASTCPMLVIETTRRRSRSTSVSHKAPATILLDGLSEPDTRKLTQSVAAGRSLSEEAVREIVRRSNGIPLYVEELAKSAVGAARAVGGSLRHGYAGSSDLANIPIVLRDAFMARVDRLPDARWVARAASCFTERVEIDALARVTSQPRVRLEAALDRLVEGDVLVEDHRALETTYAFRHALLREVVHASLLTDERRRLHTSILALLEERSQDVSPGELAYHAGQAALDEKAASLHERAGDEAIARGASIEADIHLKKALGHLESAGLRSNDSERHSRLLVKIARAAAARFGPSHTETTNALSAALEILDEARVPMYRLEAMLARCGAEIGAGNLRAAHILARALGSKASSLDEGPTRFGSLQMQAASEMFMGEFDTALKTLDLGRSLLPDAEPIGASGLRSASIADCWRMNALLATGDWSATERCMDEAYERCKLVDSPYVQANVLHHIALLHVHVRHPAADTWIARANEDERFRDIGLVRILGPALLGFKAHHAGEHSASVLHNRMTLERRRSEGFSLGLAWVGAYLGHALAATGDREEALATMQEARLRAEVGEEQYMASEAYLALGTASILYLGEIRQGLRDLGRSLRIARRQGNRLAVLRSSGALAAVFKETGRPCRAVALLDAALRATPPGGRELPDFHDARNLQGLINPRKQPARTPRTSS
jgi:class 3 adenylate cyclase/tetratricopeptide (TPR) repeat protein